MKNDWSAKENPDNTVTIPREVYYGLLDKARNYDKLKDAAQKYFDAGCAERAAKEAYEKAATELIVQQS